MRDVQETCYVGAGGVVMLRTYPWGATLLLAPVSAPTARLTFTLDQIVVARMTYDAFMAMLAQERIDAVARVALGKPRKPRANVAHKSAA